jgi:hypothetical protein
MWMSIHCPQNLMSQFAGLFDLSGDVTTTAMGFGFQFDGWAWRRVIAKMCLKLESIAPDGFAITAVKSKFGALRIAYRGGNEAVEVVIDEAKREAAGNDWDLRV